MTPAEQRTLSRADAVCERGADPQAPDVRARRKKRHIEQRGQHHADHRADEEHAPLIGPDDSPPATPAPHRFRVRREHEAAGGERHFLSADRGRNVPGALPHTVALVPRPVGERDVHHAAAAGVGDEGREQEEVRLRGEEIERAARRVERHQAGRRGQPRRGRHQEQSQDQKPAQRAAHHDPVEQFQRALDAAPHEQEHHAQQKRSDPDEVDDAGIRWCGNPSGEEKENGTGGNPGRRRPSDLEKEQDRVEPGPHGRVRTRAHEAGERRLAGGERVSHQLRVEDGLEEHRNRCDPEQGQPVSNEDGGAQEEFTSADRGTEHDHAGADGARPAEPLRYGWNGQFGGHERIDPGARFQSDGRISNQ